MERVNSVAGDVLIEIMTHLKLLTESYVSVWDKICPFRRRPYVCEATNFLADHVLLDLFCSGPASSGSSREKVGIEVKARMEVKTNAWKFLCARDNWYGFSRKPNEQKISLNKKEV